MGMREEIEDLKIWSRATAQGYVHDALRLDDVLAILDKWELVAEHHAQKVGVIIYATEDDECAPLESCGPGDTIAIYRKKG